MILAWDQSGGFPCLELNVFPSAVERGQRSLHRVTDLLSELDDLAEGAAVTSETVRQALQLA